MNKVEFLKSNDVKTLMMRGAHSKVEVINAAIEAGEIEEEERDSWEKCDKFESGYFKAVPRDGYSTYYYPSNQNVKGAFLATTLMIYW